ncbi:MAG: hypothetical protein V7K98_25200 [Nostoc sp.]|uniref:hypothetical protein n=1 Tax=Nostoc sp. TaxID=1180 RepID=UPI002FFA6DF3
MSSKRIEQGNLHIWGLGTRQYSSQCPMPNAPCPMPTSYRNIKEYCICAETWS